MDLEVRHRQGAGYQYNVQVPDIVVTKAATDGMQVRMELTSEGEVVQLYTIGNWDRQPGIQWKSDPTWGESPQSGMLKGPASTEKGDTWELHRADLENEKQRRDTATEKLNILGTGRDRNVMLRQWAQRLNAKATPRHNVLIDNREAQPGLEVRIRGCRGKDVRQAVSKARYHIKAPVEAMEDGCRTECTLVSCLCGLDGRQELRGGSHWVKVR